jgi:hypothetical protein
LFDDVNMHAGKARFQTKYAEQEQFIAEPGKPVLELSKEQRQETHSCAFFSLFS